MIRELAMLMAKCEVVQWTNWTPQLPTATAHWAPLIKFWTGNERKKSFTECSLEFFALFWSLITFCNFVTKSLLLFHFQKKTTRTGRHPNQRISLKNFLNDFSVQSVLSRDGNSPKSNSGCVISSAIAFFCY